jgi:hypothetical protein
MLRDAPEAGGARHLANGEEGSEAHGATAGDPDGEDLWRAWGREGGLGSRW